MAYNLPNLTPVQLALPLRVGLFYTTGILTRCWDLEMISFNEALGMCQMRTRCKQRPELVRVSYLQSQYKVREFDKRFVSSSLMLRGEP